MSIALLDHVYFVDKMKNRISTINADSNGNIEIDIDFVNYTSLQQQVYAHVTHNGRSIGVLGYSLAGVPYCNWYEGRNIPIPVNGGDVFKIEFIDTSNGQPLIVNGTQLIQLLTVTGGVIPADIKELTVSGTNKLLMDKYPNEPLNDLVLRLDREVASSLNLGLPQSQGVRYERYRDNVLGSNPNKIHLQLNVYRTTAELNAAIANKVPPSAKGMFDYWDRTSDDSVSGPGSYNWNYDSLTDAIIKPNNYSGWQSIISLRDHERYWFNAFFSAPTDSTDDDDFIGITLAYKRSGNKNKSLVMLLTPNGTSTNAPTPNGIWPNIGVYLNVDEMDLAATNSKLTLVAKADYPNQQGIWKNRKIRAYAERNGDIITVCCSNWGERNLRPESKIVIDLNSSADLAFFKGPSPAGYGIYSQPGGRLTEVINSYPFTDFIALNLETNRVWRYSQSIWVETMDKTISEIYGTERDITDQEGRKWRINSSGNVVAN